VEIVSHERENQKIVGPLLLFQQKFAIHVFVVERIHNLVIGDHDDVSSVTDLRSLDNRADENKQADESYDYRKNHDYGIEQRGVDFADLLLKLKVDGERFIQVPEQATLNSVIVLEILNLLHLTLIWDAEPNKRCHFLIEVAFSALRKKRLVVHIS
jgi:hypothetical protein